MDRCDASLPAITVGFLEERVVRPPDMACNFDHLFPVSVRSDVKTHVSGAEVIPKELCADFHKIGVSVDVPQQPRDFRVILIWTNPLVTFSHQAQGNHYVLMEMPH